MAASLVRRCTATFRPSHTVSLATSIVRSASSISASSATPADQPRSWIYAKQLRLPNDSFVMVAPPPGSPANIACFRVPMEYSKPQIRNYLQQLYNVRVESVSTVIQLGKAKYDPRHRPQSGLKPTRRDVKRALVRLAEGDAFPFPSLELQAQLGGNNPPI